MVIHVRRLEAETVLPQLGQRQKKRRRIGAARNGSDQPARPSPMSGEEFANGRLECLHFRYGRRHGAADATWDG
jgi:hypothetical protein